MSEQKPQGKKAKKAPKVKLEAGPPREAGVAGPDGDYIERNLVRWSLRGDGYLK